MTSQEIKDNIEKIKSQIIQAEAISSRPEGSVKLCAVSKFHPLEDVLNAISQGQFLFGENRVQEAYEKFSAVEKNLHPEIQLHIIGSLQTNKVKKAVQIADCIQSVDREELLSEIEKRCAQENKQISIFFELHTGEESKSGYDSLDSVFRSCENLCKGLYPHIKAEGLMTMAPFTEDESLIRKSFITCRNARDSINERFPELNLKELSMGMSGDFLTAIEEGSTMVRVGTAIFGQRNY